MPLFLLDGFRGDFTLLFRGETRILTSLLLPVDTAATGRLETAGDGSKCNALILGDLFWVNEADVTAAKALRNLANPPAHAALLLCNMNSGRFLKGGFGTLENAGEADDEFILRMLSLLRQSRVWTPQDDLPPGRADVRLHRLILTSGAGGVGLDITARDAVPAGR